MRNTQCSSYNKYSLTLKKSMNIAKFSEQTVLRLCSDTGTTPFKVNEASVIDRITEVNYQIK